MNITRALVPILLATACGPEPNPSDASPPLPLHGIEVKLNDVVTIRPAWVEAARAQEHSWDRLGDGVRIPRAFVRGRISAEVAAAVRVQAARIEQGGVLHVLAEAEVAVDGSFSLAVDPNLEVGAVIAVDASGRQIGGAILEGTGAAGLTAVATPITVESSVELAVLLELAACADLELINWVEIRAHIDAALGAEIHALASVDVDLAVRAMAKAILAAQEAKLRAWAEAGVNVDLAVWLEAEVAASIALSAALDAEVEAAADLEAHFKDACDAALVALGVDVSLRARAAFAASVALRAILEAELGSHPSCGQARDAAVKLALALEAHATIAAIIEVAAQASLSVEQRASIHAAIDVFLAAIISADHSNECYDAIGAIRAQIVVVIEAVLDGYLSAELGLLVSISAVLDAVIQVVVDLKADLDADVHAMVGVAAGIGGTCGDHSSLIDAILSLRAGFEADVHDACDQQIDANVDLTAELWVLIDTLGCSTHAEP
jgi:hypothetical protein